jgi:hypothetical protein
MDDLARAILGGVCVEPSGAAGEYGREQAIQVDMAEPREFLKKVLTPAEYQSWCKGAAIALMARLGRRDCAADNAVLSEVLELLREAVLLCGAGEVVHHPC